MKQKIEIKNMYIHKKEIYNLFVGNIGDNINIIGDIKGNLLMHSNISELLIKPQSQNFTVSFSYKGSFEYMRFRITTTDPTIDYEDIILYPNNNRIQDVAFPILDFNMNDSIACDISIFGGSINLIISDITFDFTQDIKEYKIASKIVRKYTKKSLLKDQQMLLAPEPHSQERAMAVYKYLNRGRISTIDLGAGGAPMMSELLLRKGKGNADLLVYDPQDVRRAKKYMYDYENRANIFRGDLTQKETLPQKQYDQILLLDVIEHIVDEKLVLENIRHLFHKDTIMIVTVPNTNYKDVMSEDFHNYVGHVRDGYSQDLLRKLFEENGYQVLETFNFAQNNKNFYTKWYGKIQAWKNSFQYSELAFEMVLKEFSPKNEKLYGEDGISNCAIVKKG